MPWFAYRDNELHAEGVPLSRIAAEVGTPAYVYSHQALEDRYRSLSDAFAGTDHLIAYAVKANASLAVLRVFARLGAGADVVSGGELQLALKAGIPAGKIIFAGVGKTREEMALGLKHGIAQFNVESEAELEALSEVAKAQGKEAPIAIRINPDVDARTHRKITTGKAENKFGIAYQRAGEVYALAARLPGIRVIGVHVHIGSQLIDLEPYESTFERVAELVTSLRRAGHDIRRVDLGGGIGIRYNGETPPDPRDYAALVRKHILPLGCEIALEPGRYLVGNAGLLLSRVTFVKRTATKSFLILDAGMNDLIRPAMYDAYHRIVPVKAPQSGTKLEPVDIVGPVCESADLFAEARPMPPMSHGDLLAILSAGAYSSVMASTYNARPLAPEVMVRGSEFAITRRRPSIDEMTALETMPAWLSEATA
ncbi:MAG TPA: diaminopimelate decarboxylase [Ferrovibrio sp.]|uniref:diaminopimelate decarboxylase n=1 Tax=Ferrovibrio sp. TaxID=1917215 RepID=UPI002B4ACB27|nr:diaminopimelate decarboxylase [Ferrovibrio sp.]HLT77623.1 diaminopimelate decarboxylase [Ferrovibrio sp.]